MTLAGDKKQRSLSVRVEGVYGGIQVCMEVYRSSRIKFSFVFQHKDIFFVFTYTLC